MTHHPAGWHLGGRSYGLTVASSPGSFDLELDHLGPGGARDLVSMASLPDDGDELVVRVFTREPLPIELLDRFLAEARRRLLPRPR